MIVSLVLRVALFKVTEPLSSGSWKGVLMSWRCGFGRACGTSASLSDFLFGIPLQWHVLQEALY